MKIKTFSGEAGEVEVAFNNWARGKALNKDIIIHSSMHYVYEREMHIKLSIVVLYPEGSRWDTELEQPRTAKSEETIREELRAIAGVTA
jgi:hypothetical protein